MRGLLVLLLAVAGLACAAFVQTMSHVGGNLVRSDRFADVVVRVIATPDGSTAVARTVGASLASTSAAQGLPVEPRVRLQVEVAVAAAVRTPAVATGLRPAVREAHRQLMDGDTSTARIRLAVLRPQVVAAVAAVDPRAVAYVPPAEAFPVVSVPVGPDAREPIAIARALRDAVPVVFVVGLACLVLAVALARSRPAVLGLLGVALLLLALLPFAIRQGGLAGARSLATPIVDPLAEELVRQLTARWLRVTVVTAAAGAALLLAARAAAGGGRAR